MKQMYSVNISKSKFDNFIGNNNKKWCKAQATSQFYTKAFSVFFTSKSNCITKNNTKTHRTSGVLIKKKKSSIYINKFDFKRKPNKMTK